MASNTLASVGVVAALSRYILFTVNPQQMI
jgi:hypothetical protein